VSLRLVQADVIAVSTSEVVSQTLPSAPNASATLSYIWIREVHGVGRQSSPFPRHGNQRESAVAQDNTKDREDKKAISCVRFVCGRSGDEAERRDTGP
jgi:hypothetical protein